MPDCELLPWKLTLAQSATLELPTLSGHSFHPYRLLGGFVSVALSLGFRPVAVSDRPVLRCPDFPLVA